MINNLNVYFHQNSSKLDVGRLAYKDRKIYFEYSKEFLNRDINISPFKLPLKSGVHSCDDRVFDGLFGVFADSLPDGWGRLLLDRHLSSLGINSASITPLDRLSYVGRYGVGALSYEPTKYDIQYTNMDIILDDLANHSSKILQGTSSQMVEELLAIGGSSAGARPKVMVQINNEDKMIHGSQKLQKDYEHYIVKFVNSTDSKDVGKLEYIYSLMARKAGIKIPYTKLITTSKNSYFAIKRFDRDELDNRYHIHSVSGMTHSDFRVPSLDYDDLLTLTFYLTKDMEQLEQIYRIAVFNLFAHNRDDHGKNLSYILKDKVWKLSPAYDLTFSFGPGGEHSTMYMGEGKNPTIEHLTKLARKHNIKNYSNIINQIKDSVSYFTEYAKEHDIPKETISLMKKAMIF